ncbi:transposase [Vibrio harveyi]|uniref:transposase n=1 Tax=Vibrio harveyi TaxID=669 RepID=UPI003BB58677
MPKHRYKTNNWKQYNQALINRGSLTFWIDEEAISEWKQSKQKKRGRPRVFSDLAITTALMVKRIFQCHFELRKDLLIPFFNLLSFHCAAHTTVVSVVERKMLR